MNQSTLQQTPKKCESHLLLSKGMRRMPGVRAIYFSIAKGIGFVMV